MPIRVLAESDKLEGIKEVDAATDRWESRKPLQETKANQAPHPGTNQISGNADKTHTKKHKIPK